MKKINKYLLTGSLFVPLLLIIVYGIIYESGHLRDVQKGYGAFMDDWFLCIIFISVCFFSLINNKNFNKQEITARAALMVASSYLSTQGFITINMHPVVAIIAGLGFVLGLSVAISIMYDKDTTRNEQTFVKRGLVLAIMLDIAMSIMFFVSAEGNQSYRSDIMNKKLLIEKQRTLQMQAAVIDSLNSGGNYLNAREHSKNFAAVKDTTNYKSSENGIILQGFINMFGETLGKICNFIFIFLASAGLTILLILVEMKAAKRKKVAFKKNENENTKNENESDLSENESENGDICPKFSKKMKVSGNEKRKKLSKKLKEDVKVVFNSGITKPSEIQKEIKQTVTPQRIGQIISELKLK